MTDRDDKPTKALATREDTALAAREPITSITQLYDRFDKAGYLLIGPRQHLPQLPAGTQISVSEVRIDSKSDADVYPVGGGKVALTKTVLDLIASAAGVSWLSINRTDDRSHPHYCEFEARAKVTDFDGTVREAVGNKTIDLREDAGGGIPGKDFTASTPKQLPGARKFATEMCASKAMNRAIASVLALRRSYAPAELAHPLIIPKLIPDTSDPAMRQAVTASMFGATDALYGPKALPPSPVVDASFEDSEPARTAGPGGDEVGGARACTPPASDPATTAAEEKYAGVGPPAMDESEKAIALIKEKWELWKTSGGPAAEFAQICKTISAKSRKEDMTLEEAKRIAAAVDKVLDPESDTDEIPV